MRKGYVALKSSHSRGSAIDLTLYRLDTGALIPMGSDFDFMDERSHHSARGILINEAKNHCLLENVKSMKCLSCGETIKL
jgi:D-alanyl-D-alanine dipeptidase